MVRLFLDSTSGRASHSAMSHALRLGSVVLAAVVGSFVAGCGSAAPEVQTGESEAASSTEATVVFHANWTTEVRGKLERGRRLKILYAPARAKCQGTAYGQPAWSVNAWYRWNGGEVRSVQVAGMRSDPSAAEPSIALDRTGRLEMWFQNNDRWGCNEYDSQFGQNYVFSVGEPTNDNAPGWVGNASYVIDRQTCNGGACAGSWKPLEGGFLYETYARQRAAVRQAGFEVWKEGVTDRDNPDLWQQLDVQVHRRFVGEQNFVTEYVSFDGRWGNNAHYALDLRALDPFAYPAGANIRTAADCPKYRLTRDASGQYVEAELELYFTVNGTELRPAAGGTFKGRYQDYLGNFAVCTQ